MRNFVQSHKIPFSLSKTQGNNNRIEFKKMKLCVIAGVLVLPTLAYGNDGVNTQPSYDVADPHLRGHTREGEHSYKVQFMNEISCFIFFFSVD